jgi:Ni/Co efflux regulator RcnB
MKKILSTIVAALVAVSFAGLVFAQDAPAPAASPAAPAAGEVKKVEKAPVKKHTKHMKHKRTKKARKVVKKEQTAPVEAPAAK